MTNLDTHQAIELIIAVLAVASLVAIAARPLRIPQTLALVVVGLVIGGIAGSLGLQGGLEVTPELVLVVLLPGLVFEAAYRLRLAELRRWYSGLALLAVPGVLISAGIVALVLHLATGLRADLAFLVGAMVSATDPAAVVATFKRIKVSRPMATLVDGESLLNDGTGLVLFAIAVRAVSEPVGPMDAVLSFVAAVTISAIIGLAAGFLAARLIAGVHDHLIELTISVVLAYGTYLIADELHLSGVIATVTAAVVFGNYGPGRTLSQTGADAIDTVWEFLAYLLTAVVFLLVGLAIPPARLLDSMVPIAWAVAGMLVGRALIVYVLFGAASRLAPFPGMAGAVPMAWLHVMFWAGLRGAVAVAMALALPRDMPQRELLQDITFGAVLFTLVVQATTIGRVVERARAGGDALKRPERKGRPGGSVHAHGRGGYHSARVWRILMLCRMPRPIAMLTRDAPPCVTNGNGMPVIGMIPITMPAFTISWKRIIDAMPAANIDPNGSRDRQPATSTRHSNSAKSTNRTRPPTNPSSSASTENTKSVVWTGRKSPCAWVPLVSPRPNHPPEPTAIWDWYS